MAVENGIYTVIVDANGDIYEHAGYQRGRKLGIDIRQEARLYEENQALSQNVTELTEVLENWRPIMIETGHLVIPKTPEEIAQEMAQEQIRIIQEQKAQQDEINRVLLDSVRQSNAAIQGLKNTIEELTRHEHDRDRSSIVVNPSPKKQPQTRQDSGEKPAASRVRVKAGPSDVAADPKTSD